MKTCINDAIKKYRKSLVALYCSESLDQFCAGYIVAADDDFFLLQVVNPEGEHDGFLAARIEEVRMVEIDSRDLKRLKFLEDHGVTDSMALPGKPDPHQLLRSLLEIARKNGIIIEIRIQDGDSYVTGIVTALDESLVTVDQIDNYWGYNDGVAVMPIGKIDCIEVLSRDCLRTQLLHEEWSS